MSTGGRVALTALAAVVATVGAVLAQRAAGMAPPSNALTGAIGTVVTFGTWFLTRR